MNKKYWLGGGLIGGFISVVLGVVLYFGCYTPTCSNIFSQGILYVLQITWLARQIFVVYLICGFILGAIIGWIIGKIRTRNDTTTN